MSEALQRAELLLQSKRPAAAAQAALEHLARHPDDPSGLRTLGLAQHQSGHGADGEATLRAAVAADPTNAWGQYLLAWAILTNGRNAAAQEPAQQALALDPDLPQAHELLAWIHWRLGRPQAALASIDTALRLLPQDPDYLRLRAELLRARGDTAAARDTTSAALHVAPSDPALLRLHGELALAHARTGEAIAALQAAVQRDPHDARARGELLHALRSDHWLHRAIWRRFPHLHESRRFVVPTASIAFVMIVLAKVDRAPAPVQKFVVLAGAVALFALRWSSLRLLLRPLPRQLLGIGGRLTTTVQILLLLGAFGLGLGACVWPVLTRPASVLVQSGAMLAFAHLLAEAVARERRRGWSNP